jgi:alcohol dehydrogenase (cytochrome c)
VIVRPWLADKLQSLRGWSPSLQKRLATFTNLPQGRVAMMRRVAAAAICALGLIACSPKTAPSPTAEIAAQWPMYNGTYSGIRYSTLDQITASNANSVHVLCKKPLGEVGPFQAGPVVVQDTVFVTTKDNTYAIDATNCSLKWKSTYTPSGPEVFNTNRGVAYDGGKLFRGTQDGHVIALDATNGAAMWNVQAADPHKGFFLSAAPIVWNNLVFMGVAGADWGTRGQMMALDENDGHKVWSFELVPTGHATGADSWHNKDSTTTGGGSTWTSFALDPATHELFVPVGNPAPDFDANYRPGDNLFTDSLVVLDAATGKLLWWYQLVPHDTHDYDLGAPPALVSTTGGANLAVVSGKNGYLYALDRTSHKVRYKVAVTTIKNSDTVPTPQGSYTCPGWVGGTEWNGPAYDVRHNSLIVGANDWCGKYTLNPGTPHFTPGKFFLDGTFVNDPWTAAHGWLTSIDADSGKVLWRYHSPAPIVAAVEPTAGDVVITGDLGGALLILDAKNGKMLASIKTGGAIAGGIVTYELNNKQYVVFDSGNVSRSIWSGTSGPATVYILSQ